MELISYDDFKKLDMRIVKVVNVERIPRKNRILKLTIEIGSGETRVMIAGGAEFYSQEDFLEKKFVALINLAPKKIANIESCGMLLAAVSGQKPFWLSVDEDAPIGAKII